MLNQPYFADAIVGNREHESSCLSNCLQHRELMPRVALAKLSHIYHFICRKIFLGNGVLKISNHSQHLHILSEAKPYTRASTI
jgi:hypothetical protein